jgi:isopentenyldiphosphate isomerase
MNGDIAAHPEEIADWQFIAPGALTRAIAENGDQYTPWLKLEWEKIRQDHLDDILAGIG